MCCFQCIFTRFTFGTSSLPHDGELAVSIFIRQNTEVETKQCASLIYFSTFNLPVALFEPFTLNIYAQHAPTHTLGLFSCLTHSLTLKRVSIILIRIKSDRLTEIVDFSPLSMIVSVLNYLNLENW